MPDKTTTIAEVCAEAGKPFRETVEARRQAKIAEDIAVAEAAAKQKHDDAVAAEVERARVTVEANKKIADEAAAAQAILDAAAGKKEGEAAAAPAEDEPIEAAAKAVEFAFKANEELGVIEGIASVADIFDRENERVQKGALVGMAFEFCAKSKRDFKINHTEKIDCELVESYTGALTKVPGVIDHSVKSHWFVTLKPKDPAILEAAKAGQVVGMSWGGGKETQDAA